MRVKKLDGAIVVASAKRKLNERADQNNEL